MTEEKNEPALIHSLRGIIFTGFIKKQWDLEHVAGEMSAFSVGNNEKVLFSSIYHQKYSWYADENTLKEYDGAKGFIVLHSDEEKTFFRVLDFLLIEIEAVSISIEGAELEIFQRHRLPFNSYNPQPSKDIFESNICSGYRTFFSSSIFPMICEFSKDKWAINGVSSFSSNQGARNGAPKWITLEKTDEKGNNTIFEYSRIDNSKRKIPINVLADFEKSEKEFWENLKKELSDITEMRNTWNKGR